MTVQLVNRGAPDLTPLRGVGVYGAVLCDCTGRLRCAGQGTAHETTQIHPIVPIPVVKFGSHMCICQYENGICMPVQIG